MTPEKQAQQDVREVFQNPRIRARFAKVVIEAIIYKEGD